MPAALFICNSRSPEFAAALIALGEAFDVKTHEGVAAACGPLCQGTQDEACCGVELIVLAQSRPGEFTAAEVDRLRRRFPSAAVISLLGSWSEGETRSGKPLATACRLYWHQAADRLRRDIARRASGQSPLWSLPTTSTEDERVLRSAAAPPRQRTGKECTDDKRSSRATVALFGHDRSSIAWLVDACRAGGYEPVWMGPRCAVEPCDVVAAIWDLTAWTSASADELRQITRFVPAHRVVALLGFPRWHDIQRAARQGLGAIISKPLVLDDLYSAINRFVEPATESATAKR
ncbi:MAG: hypothetical protein K2Y37_20720 [Pirellulales bacterium]|nr:hypothetical protein [Pirellulales bacterium]